MRQAALFGFESQQRPPGARPLRTYGLPTLITNCSNNYGPYHFPEKLIPLTILNALAGKLPVYGNGQQIRDWLYVEDHARRCIWWRPAANRAKYNIGGHNERKISRWWKPFVSCWKSWRRMPQGVAAHAI